MARRRSKNSVLDLAFGVAGALFKASRAGVKAYNKAQPKVVSKEPSLNPISRSFARGSLHKKAEAAIDQDIKSLARRKAQLIYKDAYGKWQQDKWLKELKYFINDHIGQLLSENEKIVLNGEWYDIARNIDLRVNEMLKNKSMFGKFSKDMTPTEFEIFCAEELKQVGWDARVTKQSGDQGVDVIAEKDGVRVVVQCKLYSKAVGNKAVQEVVAARAHEQARYGVVVSNNSYTPAAVQLAATNKVLLLHYHDLVDLEEHLFGE